MTLQGPKSFLWLGALTLLACAWAGHRGAAPFFEAYLFAYLFWLQFALGSTAYLMMHVLTGGTWGGVIRPYLRASNRTYLLLAILFIPILLGLGHLYPWTHAGDVARDPKLRHKAIYLNIPFFFIRSAIYLGSWYLLSSKLHRLSAPSLAQDEAAQRSLRQLSGGGMVWYGFSATFALVDWSMTLEPHWYSTIYGMIVVAAQGLTAIAFCLWLLGRRAVHQPLQEALEPKTRRDLGNLLFANVIVWAYLSFVQYLVVWSGNLPEEVAWFLHRTSSGWQWAVTLIAIFQFGAPFLLLLYRPAKHHLRILGSIALGVLLIRIIDTAWLVLPAFSERDHASAWASIGVRLLGLAGVGGIWAWAFARNLEGEAFPLPEEVTHAA